MLLNGKNVIDTTEERIKYVENNISEIIPDRNTFMIIENIYKNNSEICKNIPDETKSEHLYISCMLNQIELFKTIKNKMKNPFYNNNEIFVIACKYGKSEIVKILLEDPLLDPSYPFNQAIICAFKNGHDNIVKILMDKKQIFKNKWGMNKLLKIAIKKNKNDILCNLFQKNNNITKWITNKNIANVESYLSKNRKIIGKITKSINNYDKNIQRLCANTQKHKSRQSIIGIGYLTIFLIFTYTTIIYIFFDLFSFLE